MQTTIAKAVRQLLATTFTGIVTDRTWVAANRLSAFAAAANPGDTIILIAPGATAGNDAPLARGLFVEREVAIDVGFHVKVADALPATIDPWSDQADSLRKALWYHALAGVPEATWLKHTGKSSFVADDFTNLGVYSSVFTAVYKAVLPA